MEGQRAAAWGTEAGPVWDGLPSLGLAFQSPRSEQSQVSPLCVPRRNTTVQREIQEHSLDPALDKKSKGPVPRFPHVYNEDSSAHLPGSLEGIGELTRV